MTLLQADPGVLQRGRAALVRARTAPPNADAAWRELHRLAALPYRGAGLCAPALPDGDVVVSLDMLHYARMLPSRRPLGGRVCFEIGEAAA